MGVDMWTKRLGLLTGLALLLGLGGAGLTVTDAGARRNVVHCAHTPSCRITCSSNRPVACFAQVQPNGRCFRRCIRR
jgi:hypothetical protein